MQTTTAHHILEQFRRDAYRTLGPRKDSLFELMEAALVAPGPATLVHLSLTAPFRRRWSSAPDALADGGLDADCCRRLIHHCLAQQATRGRPVWAHDGTVWPRPAAKTSPERTHGHRTTPGTPQSGLIPAWEYEWLVDVPEPRGSWIRPLEVGRRGPGRGTPTELAISQVRTALTTRPAGGPRPVVVLDSNYDPVQLVRAELDADLLVRVRSRRKFYRAPGPYRGRGAPAKHGPVFKLWDVASQRTPARSATIQDAEHGQVRVDVWHGLHVLTSADAVLTLVRIQVERLPRRNRPPAPLWLAWIGGELPDDLLELWRWYGRRFTLEHGFRFLKQDLGWTTVRPSQPAAADRWSWLLALALWQLWLARPIVADQRFPWERSLPAHRLSPGRVRRAFAAALLRLPTPARPVRRRGKSAGRRPGERPGPRPQYEVARRRPPRAA